MGDTKQAWAEKKIAYAHVKRLFFEIEIAQAHRTKWKESVRHCLWV